MPLGMYDNIVYYHNTRKKANRKPVNFLKMQKAQELFKTSAPFTELYGICARSFGKNVSFTRAEPFSFG